MGKVRDIGYEAIQISGIGVSDPQIVKESLDKHQLYACATHEGLAGLRENFAGIVAKMKLLECDFTVIDNEPRFCEIGEGNLDWPSILQACEETGVRWYSIEQDQETPGRNIFESIKVSFDNLKAMGVK